MSQYLTALDTYETVKFSTILTNSHIDDIGLESIILEYGKLIECYEDSLPLDISDGYIWSVYFGNNPDRSINDGDQVTLISEIHILHIYI